MRQVHDLVRMIGTSPPSAPLDYSTPEAQEALVGISAMVLEVRDQYAGPMARRLALYERTLGLAVIPVLLRRAVIVLARRLGSGRGSQ